MTPHQKAIEAAAKAACGEEWNARDFNETMNGDDPEDARDYWRDKSSVIIAAYLSAMRPEGWKMTLEEPTEEMKKASSRGDGNRAAFYWRAMHKAAPEPE